MPRWVRYQTWSRGHRSWLLTADFVVFVTLLVVVPYVTSGLASWIQFTTLLVAGAFWGVASYYVVDRPSRSR